MKGAKAQWRRGTKVKKDYNEDYIISYKKRVPADLQG